MAKVKNVNTTENDDDVFAYFRKELGATDKEKVEDFISTGSTLLDYAIANKRNGGVPVGRITEVVGGEASGKSLLAYHIMANTQKRGGIAVYIDTEHAYNKEFMERMGVNTKKLIMPDKTPGSIEEVFEYIEKVVMHTRLKFPEKNKLVTVVWDSVASTPGKDELETDHTANPRMAVEARAMSRSLRKTVEALDSGYVTLICINQLREKIGVTFGESDIAPGGRALPFYASVRLKLKSLSKLKDAKTERVIGVGTQIKTIKNKVAPGWRSIDTPIYFDWGINDEISWLEFLKDLELVKTSGAWSTLYANGEEHKFQGVTGWAELMKKDHLKKFALDEIEKHMVVNFERRPEDMDVNVDSLLEVDQLKNDLEGR